MDKILSINTIKNVFAALGAKTSDNNYAVALLDKGTAEPKGLMSMPDLATTLGVGGKLNGRIVAEGTLGRYGIYPCSFGTAVEFTTQNADYHVFLLVEMAGGAVTTGRIWIAIGRTIDSNTQWRLLTTN